LIPSRRRSRDSPCSWVREPARNASAAQQRYLHYLQRSLSCLTDAIWVVGTPPDARGDDRALTVSEEPIRLRHEEGSPLLLYASQRFDVIEDERFPGEWKARTHGYVYSTSVETPDEDEGAQELLAWHWHPLTTPDRQQPHLHVRMDHPFLGVTLSRLHIPSGRVAFEEIVRLLITELHVQTNRDDWHEVLTDSEHRFREFRTWA
jgi:hypothetical protein